MFFLPLFDELPTGRRPFVTWIIFLLCVIGFFWQQSLTDKQGFIATFQFGFVPALFFNYETLPQNMTAVTNWATLVTSMFLHVGWLHIAGNMLYLWIFSDNVENAMGTVRFIIFTYCAAVPRHWPKARLTRINSANDWRVGCVAGILGAYLPLHPKAAVRCFLLIIIFIRFINLPAWLVLAFGLVVSLLPYRRRWPIRAGRRCLHGAYWWLYRGHDLNPVFQETPCLAVRPRPTAQNMVWRANQL